MPDSPDSRTDEAGARSRKGFAEEVLPEFDRLHRVAVTLSGSRSLAKALLQRTVSQGYRQWRGRPAEVRTRVWLIGILRDEFLVQAPPGPEIGTTHEERGVDPAADQGSDEEQGAIGEQGFPPSQAVFDPEEVADEALVRIHPRSELLDWITEADIRRTTEHLDRGAREVLALADIGGLTYDELAGMLDVIRDHARDRLYRARWLLRARLLALAAERGYTGG